MNPAIARISNIIFDHFYWRSSQSEFNALLRKNPEPTADHIVRIVRNYRGAGFYKRLYPIQVEREFRQLIDWAAARKPAVILEIGTYWGGSLLAWSRIAGQAVVSVDIEGVMPGGGYPRQKRRLFDLFTADRPGVELALIQADSHDPRTRDQATAVLAGRPLDMLFIDGDHSLEGVTADFELWSPLVRPGGHVVFHDIVKHARPEIQVRELWLQLKERFRHWEIVDRSNQGGCGIGILEIP